MSAKKRKQQKNAHHNEDAAEKRVAKKAAVLGTEKNPRLPLIATFVCIAVIVGGVVLYQFNSHKNGQIATAETAGTSQDSPAQAADEIRHPASLFVGGQAQYFHYEAENITIKYFRKFQVFL